MHSLYLCMNTVHALTYIKNRVPLYKIDQSLVFCTILVLVSLQLPLSKIWRVSFGCNGVLLRLCVQLLLDQGETVLTTLSVPLPLDQAKS
jgi:hypothetical protein